MSPRYSNDDMRQNSYDAREDRNGDKIVLLGFSRGGYTALLLAAIILVIGIMPKDCKRDVIDEAFKAYKKRDFERARKFTQEARYAHIEFVGLWYVQ